MKLAPHSLFFLLISVLYGGPIFITLFWRINEHTTYVNDLLSLYQNTRWSVLIIYLISIISFLLGSGFMSTIMNRLFKTNNLSSIPHFYSKTLKIAFFQKMLIFTFIGLGIIMLIQMFQSGTFSSDYTESFEHGFEAQNVFTLLCDIFFFFFIYLWFNFKGSYKKTKYLLLLMIFTTLIKGSRMFMVPLLFLFLYHIIYIKGLNYKNIFYILMVGIFALLGLCSVFFFRHGADPSGDDISSLLFLLIQYESCGIHIPLMKEILLDWHTSFAPIYRLTSDTLLFTVPRIIFPDKNQFLFFDNTIAQYNLSPYGGINGEASVILYFGLLFPFFFFLIGSLFSGLYKLTKSNSNHQLTPIYIFICCSFIFTFLRNGILIAIKNIIIIGIIFGALSITKRIVIKSKQ